MRIQELPESQADGPVDPPQKRNCECNLDERATVRLDQRTKRFAKQAGVREQSAERKAEQTEECVRRNVTPSSEDCEFHFISHSAPIPQNHAISVGLVNRRVPLVVNAGMATAAARPKQRPALLVKYPPVQLSDSQ
jgi:hypothetical protein